MGAKQSKRSVDISGKEVESAGEVAAAGAGGEGRVEPLADIDALKPQLNGDAHIQQPHEQTDKEKQLDSGTPENEKDATTEKENKQEENGDGKEKEAAPVTNGESEAKAENGDATPTAEDGKKPKKEKVKKKWSLRSISFSRKDKPKQEKKQKDEEAKTNGEPEKVPEEAAEATPETVGDKPTLEVKSEVEIKDEKTPETPVTEPITNGSSTPETPKVASPTSEKVAVPEPTAAVTDNDRPEPAPVALQPEQLPINGLSLEEPKKEEPVVALSDDNKNEDSKPEKAAENVPAPEIPVKTEVCVKQMPLIESTPPPLPANPPPSSVVSFAATTMAPELIDASLANTADSAMSTPSLPDTKSDRLNEAPIQTQVTLTNSENVANTELPLSTKEYPEEKPVEVVSTEAIKQEEFTKITEHNKVSLPSVVSDVKVSSDDTIKEIVENSASLGIDQQVQHEISTAGADITKEIKNDTEESTKVIEELKKTTCEENGIAHAISEDLEKDIVPSDVETNWKTLNNSCVDNEEKTDNIAVVPNLANTESVETEESSNSVDELPPPPPPIDEEISHIDAGLPSDDTVAATKAIEVNGDETERENAKNKMIDVVPVECNGNETIQGELGKVTTPDDSAPSLSESMPPAPVEEGPASCEQSESFPLPPSELCPSEDASPAPSPEPADPASLADPSQDIVAVSEKIADLLPEVAVPELKTDILQETTNDVAVAN